MYWLIGYFDLLLLSDLQPSTFFVDHIQIYIQGYFEHLIFIYQNIDSS